MKCFEQEEREKDENSRIRGSSEGYIQELTVQSEALELAECCATMLCRTEKSITELEQKWRKALQTRKWVLDKTMRGSSGTWDRKVPSHSGVAL